MNDELGIRKTEEAPRIEMLLKLLNWMTLEQLQFFEKEIEQVVRLSGYARIEIEFKNGHADTLYPAAGLKFPSERKQTEDED
ncbi:MAG: hypothetical protein COZ56_03285 [Armatimonadetes bacterium CG_4_8_14_3_um_filter_58_9]|nr:MAG: hypothetical protein COZ56_03285 [Armatimonadetes bacterium CG_4_8_14_3_um_filter_58_9]